jgi:aquaporin Z
LRESGRYCDQYANRAKTSWNKTACSKDFVIRNTMLDALKNHWPEYLIEAWCLGSFMVSACAFGVLLNHPASPVTVLGAMPRMMLMGLAMGTTATSIICSPWGRRSGAHYNPAVTLTFFRLGKIKGSDAVFYIVSQFIGGAIGVALAWLFLGNLLADSAVNFVATLPGKYGDWVAFSAETGIAFFMMTMILWTSNTTRWSRFTPYFAGILVASFIAVESPVSGMSMNPARTFASAVVGGVWTSLWIYFIAPTIAMLAAAEVFVRLRGLKNVFCAKLHHHNSERCIFNCRFGELADPRHTETKRISNMGNISPTDVL